MFRFRQFLLLFLACLLCSGCTFPTAAKQAVTVTPAPPTSTPVVTAPNEYVTVAQLNFWFRGAGCGGGFEAWDCSGKRNNGLIPALGETYDNASQAVISQQIDWAVQYGVDAFSIEWTTPRGISGSLEEVLDNNFLKSKDLSKVRWCIFYDLVLRLDQTPGLNVDFSKGMDFDNPDVYKTFVSDFEHFAKKYFKQPQYLKIDDRPVVYIWGTWNATGNYMGAFKEAREKAAALGYDVYLVGDIIRTDRFYQGLASVYDANSNFVLFVPGSDMPKNTGDAVTILDSAFTKWEKEITGVKVMGRDDPVIIQPGFTPQYDDRVFASVNHDRTAKYVPALSKEQVMDMALMVRDHAQPAGSEGAKLIWLNTWNNWPETTTFEPTIDSGEKYPAGNYQFDMVEIVRDVFGVETFSQ